jgi:hypothetical protein
MNSLLPYLWAGLIVASIAWYAFLVVHIGRKAGTEIRELIRTLSERGPPDPPAA